jgi:hypothetical protein
MDRSTLDVKGFSSKKIGNMGQRKELLRNQIACVQVTLCVCVCVCTHVYTYMNEFHILAK